MAHWCNGVWPSPLGVVIFCDSFFGNIRRKPQLGRATVDVKKEREPLVDVTLTDGEIKVVVELPGVDKGILSFMEPRIH